MLHDVPSEMKLKTAPRMTVRSSGVGSYFVNSFLISSFDIVVGYGIVLTLVEKGDVQVKRTKRPM